MVFDIVKMILGELPPQFEFLYSFGIVFVLYIFLKIFKLRYDKTKNSNNKRIKKLIKYLDLLEYLCYNYHTI